MYYSKYKTLKRNDAIKFSNLFDRMERFYNYHMELGNQIYVVTLTGKCDTQEAWDRAFVCFRKKINSTMPSEAYGSIEHKGDSTGWHGHFLVVVNNDWKPYKVRKHIRECWHKFHGKYIAPAPLNEGGEPVGEHLTSTKEYDVDAYADRGWIYSVKVYKKAHHGSLVCVKPRGARKHFQRKWGLEGKRYWKRQDMDSTRMGLTRLQNKLHDRTSSSKKNL